MPRDVKILDRQYFPAGTLVIQQGTFGNKAYVIESGEVEVFVNDAHGNPVAIGTLGPKDMFGEMAVVREERRSANVRTTKDSVLIIVSAHEFHESMTASGNFFSRIMSMTTQRMKDTSTKLMKKERKLAAIEKAAPMSLKNVALNVSKVEEVKVRQEVRVVDKKLVKAGTLVIEQGTVGNTAFLIESGRVQVFKVGENGAEIPLAELGAKALIGEIGALSNKPRNASVRALEDTVLIPVSASELQVIMSTSDDLYKNLFGMIVDRLKDGHRKVFGKEPAAEVSPELKMSAKAQEDPENRGVAVMDKLKSLLEKSQDK